MTANWPATRCRRVAAAGVRLLSDVAIDIELSDAQQSIKLDGQISVKLELSCQRCLQSMSWQLDESIRLLLVPPGSTTEATGQYEQYELDECGCIDAARWIEDEILLRIPNVPTHSRRQDCDPDILERAQEFKPDPEQGVGDQDNPFRILKSWKGLK